MSDTQTTDPRLKKLLESIAHQIPANQRYESLQFYEGDKRVFSSTLDGQVKLAPTFKQESVDLMLSSLEKAVGNPKEFEGTLRMYLGDQKPENQILLIEDGTVKIDRFNLVPVLNQTVTITQEQPITVSVEPSKAWAANLNKALWDRYSPKDLDNNPTSRSLAAAYNALNDKQPKEVVREMLKADPEYGRIKDQQTVEAAEKNAEKVLNCAQGKVQAKESPVYQKSIEAMRSKQEVVEMGR